jgi:hypothetical protein
MLVRIAWLCAVSILAAASPAWATTLVSPSVSVTNVDNTLDCRLVNAGKKPISVLFEIVNGDGVVSSSDTFEVPAGGARALALVDTNLAGHCRFTGKFPKKGVRATISVLDELSRTISIAPAQ